MLSEAKFPNHYWGETLYIIVHVLNLTPNVALNNEVLEKFGLERLSSIII